MSRHFPLPCECGRIHPVIAAQAGTVFSCPCGLEQKVPTLSVLRQLAVEEQQPIASGRRAGRRVPLPVWTGTSIAIALIVLLVGAWRFRVWIPTPKIPEIQVRDDDADVFEAVQAARQAVEQSPRSAAAWGHLAMVLHGNTLENSADPCYAAAADLDPSNPNWPYLRGYLHQDGPGGPGTAIPYYQLAAGLGPQNSVARMRLGEMLLAQGRFDEAAAEFNKMLAADPRDADAQFGKGAIAVARRDFAEARDILESVADHPRVQRRVSELLGSVYERLGDSAAAGRQRERLKMLPEDSVRPDDPMLQVGEVQVGLKARLRKANRLRQQQHYQDALVVLRDAAQRYPKSDEAWSNLGAALHHMGDAAGAEQAMRNCVDLVPKSAEYRLNLGMLLLTQQRFAEAGEVFRECIELRPKFGLAHFGLGESLLGIGDLHGAKDAYENALLLLPDDERIRQRIQELSEHQEVPDTMP